MAPTDDSGSRTSPSLLERLGRDPADAAAWDEFVRRYRPRIHAWCTERGVQGADADDVAQEVLSGLVATMRQFRYDPRHAVRLVPGSQCSRLAGGATELMVNSLHAQAIDRLADGLVIEAVTDDGTIEAVRVKDATAFALGIQWHPEARLAEDAWSQALFTAFGDACRAYAARRRALSAGRAA